MKNISELKQEILDNQKTMKDEKTTNRKYNSLSKKNERIREIIMYLETSPREEYLKNEKTRMLKIIKSKESEYDYWSGNVCAKEIETKKRKAIFNRENGLTTLKRQIKTISYILSA